MKFSKILAVSFLLLGLVISTGCSKDLGYRKLTGTVTMDGQPLEGASLTFYAEGGGEGGSGMTGADGKYDVTAGNSPEGGLGLKPGTYKVTIVKMEQIVDEDEEAQKRGEITYDELQKRKAKKGAYAKSAKPNRLTPAKYASTFDTPLSVTVSDDPAANVFDFNLDE